MDKKLTRFDIIIVLGFLFTLIVGVGAFFYGVQTGKEQTDAKYRSLIAELTDEKSQNDVAYHQHQLVSFYHTVLLPFREFQNTWFAHMDTIGIGDGATDDRALLQAIQRLANEKGSEIKPSTIPEVSPLLRKAQSDYLKSLTLFSEAASRLQDGPRGSALVDSMRQDPYVLEAAGYALRAQLQFYEAIREWQISNHPDDDSALIAKQNLSMSEWRKLTLNGKNVQIARILMEDGVFVPVYPQDIAARIDDLDDSGQTSKLKLEDVASSVTILLSAGGVREGDFIRNKNRLYRHEALPQLPFFSE